MTETTPAGARRIQAGRPGAGRRPHDDAGRRQRPPALPSHSLLADRTSFDLIAGPLAARHQVVALNLPGFGGSDAVDDGLEAVADRVAEALEALRLPQKPIFLGNGYGGFVALLTALRHPARVERLVLADCGAAFSEPGRAAFRGMSAAAEKGGLAAVADVAMRRLFAPEYQASHPELIAARKTSGACSCGTCAHPGRTTSRASGRPAASSCDMGGGVASSISPTSTRTGCRTDDSRGRRSSAARALQAAWKVRWVDGQEALLAVGDQLRMQGLVLGGEQPPHGDIGHGRQPALLGRGRHAAKRGASRLAERRAAIGEHQALDQGGVAHRRQQRDEAAITVAQEDRLLGQPQGFEGFGDAVGHGLEAAVDGLRASEPGQVQRDDLVPRGQRRGDPVEARAVGQQRVEQHERTPAAADLHRHARRAQRQVDRPEFDGRRRGGLGHLWVPGSVR